MKTPRVLPKLNNNSDLMRHNITPVSSNKNCKVITVSYFMINFFLCDKVIKSLLDILNPRGIYLLVLFDGNGCLESIGN